ncbi:oleandomycin glycosyltransferase [Streptomyces sp. NBC_00569]|uniref:macrolide family glycosyltransferase n=1 Tax=Streptomyces sp. NBC_00569 TaxID=2975780 RepID=UPI002E81739A|nr:macrolide family glycosyltransferase [Streptomyces sp. NBC_00569]WUB93034.1 oleandomycin glycosyltransferase [Streptomyces sp. NBC_00569]
MQKHIAFLNIPAAGHVTPTLGVVEELVRRGHKVSYLAADGFAEKIASTGADVIPYATTLDPRTIAPTGAEDWLARVLLGAVREAAATAPTLEAHFGDDLPDCLVYDISMQFLGRVMSRKFGVPGIQLYPVLASHQYFSEAEGAAEGMFGQLTRELRAFADAHGLQDVTLDELMSDAPRNISFMPREFQSDADSFPEDRYTFVGIPLRESDLQGTWQPSSDKPVVLISLGTTFNTQPEFFAMCAKAFEGLPWHVVIAAGPGVDLEAVGELPPNAEIHTWLTLQAVLEHAGAFVCHGGAGNTMNALYAGVPLVSVPHNGDSEMIAARTGELRLGRVLPPEEVTAETLREAVLEVAADETVQANLRDMRKYMKEAGGAPRAADTILGHLHTVSE